MRIYIAGAGAMGCRFGYHFMKTEHEVILLDNWEAHIEAIQKNGLHIVGAEEKNVQLNIMRPTEAKEPADLIILFTKAMQLEKMLQDIQGIITEETQVLCLLNGLGHEEVIQKHVKKENIIMGVTVWTAGLAQAGTVKLQGTGTIDLQSMNKDNQEKGREIADILNKADLNANYDEDVIPSIWRKACVNGTMNSLCALLDATIGEVFAQEEGLELIRAIIHEFVIVGQAEGVALDEQAITDYVMAVSVKAAAHYPSMHQDLVQNKRFTEIDYINGAVARKAEKLGLDTPYCRMVTQLIHTKEKISIK